MFAGMHVATSKGILGFDDEGTCVVEDDVADSLSVVAGYEVVEDDSQNSDDNNTDDDADKDPEDEGTTAGNEPDGANETEEDKEDEVDLKSLTVPALKKYAKDHNIDITGLNTKDQLLKALQG